MLAPALARSPPRRPAPAAAGLWPRAHAGQGALLPEWAILGRRRGPARGQHSGCTAARRAQPAAGCLPLPRLDVPRPRPLCRPRSKWWRASTRWRAARACCTRRGVGRPGRTSSAGGSASPPPTPSHLRCPPPPPPTPRPTPPRAQVAETLPQDILTRIKAPPKADDPAIAAEELPEFDGFVFGMPTRRARAARPLLRWCKSAAPVADPVLPQLTVAVGPFHTPPAPALPKRRSFGMMPSQMKALWDATGGPVDQGLAGGQARRAVRVGQHPGRRH